MSGECRDYGLQNRQAQSTMLPTQRNAPAQRAYYIGGAGFRTKGVTRTSSLDDVVGRTKASDNSNGSHPDSYRRPPLV